MGGPPFVIDPAVLRAEATTLRNAGTSIGAAQTISSPDAGSSTNETADIIGRITSEMTKAARTAESLARALETAAASFVQTDSANADRFPTGGPSGPPAPQPGPTPTPAR